MPISLSLLIAGPPAGAAPAGAFTVPAARCAVALPPKPNAVQSFAAEELRRHLSLALGAPVPLAAAAAPPGAFLFRVGARPEQDAAPLAPEEGRYRVTPEAVYFYGDDRVARRGDDAPVWGDFRNSRTGTLFAVYAFLENELGVRWVAPGDAGIACRPRAALELSPKAAAWAPEVAQRIIRPTLWGAYLPGEQKEHVPPEFQVPEAECARRAAEDILWARRMRMGRNIRVNYRHAFTDWWERYGAQHPEFFALTDRGARRPLSPDKPDRVKMCVSNPGLHREIVAQWRARGYQDPINVCENDSAGYCRCDACRALDAPLPGEAFGEHLSDRYVWFSNAVLTEARKHAPDAKVVMYAYSAYRRPPRREKLLPGVIVGLVPGAMPSPAEVEAAFQGWREAGGREFIYRPNDLNCDAGLPMGFEKLLFDQFQAARRMGAIGFDSQQGFWATAGIANYALARAMSDPAKPFEHWEAEYASAYGAAAPDVRDYFRHWRANWERVIQPDREAMLDRQGRNGSYRGAFYSSLDRYFTEDGFDHTDAILARASARQLTAPERARLDQLILANRHGRLTFLALRERHPDAENAKQVESAVALARFRRAHKDDLNTSWPMYFRIEKLYAFTDIAAFASFFERAGWHSRLPLYWKFRADPDGQGERAGWHQAEAPTIAGWDEVATDRFWWQDQDRVSPELQAVLRAPYGGTAWYCLRVPVPEAARGKAVYLVLGNAIRHCTVFVNGKKVGERRVDNKVNREAWRVPFRVRVDEAFAPGETQGIALRVEGSGQWSGILRRAWLVAEGE